MMPARSVQGRRTPSSDRTAISDRVQGEVWRSPPEVEPMIGAQHITRSCIFPALSHQAPGWDLGHLCVAGLGELLLGQETC